MSFNYSLGQIILRFKIRVTNSKNVLTYLLFSPIGVLIAIGLSVFHLNEAVVEFNQARLLELLLLAWFSAIALRAVPNQQSTSALKYAGFFVFFGLGLISAIAAKYPLEALQDWAHYALVAASVTAFASLASQNLQLAAKILMAGIIVGISLALARFLIQLILTASLGVVTPLAQWWSPYTNPRFVAQALIWIIPLLTALPVLWPAFRKRSLIAMYTLGSGTWMLLFWTGGRAEVLGLALSMGLVATLIWRQAFFFLASMSLYALTGFSLWLLTRLTLNYGTTGGVSLSFARLGVSGRDWLFERSLQLVAQHSWLGVGPAHFSVYNYNTTASSHPHNLILQIAAEWGLPAVALFVYLLWRFVRRQYQLATSPLTTFDSSDNVRHALRIPLLVTLFAAIFTSMLDGIHVMPLSELIGVPILGFMIAINAPAESQHPPPERPSIKIFVLALVIFCWGILLYGIVQQRDCLTYPIQAERLIGGRIGYDNPRFWIQGRIPIGEGCMEIGRYQHGLDTLTGRSVDAPSTTEQYWR